jgi:hypothetical protein
VGRERRVLGRDVGAAVWLRLLLDCGIGADVGCGTLVSLIVDALENATVVGAMSAAGAGLFAMGIPHTSILRCETAPEAGKLVLIAHGGVKETNRAKEILGRGKPDTLEHHQ